MRRRRRQNDDNEGVWHQRRIEMLTQLHLLMHECVRVCILTNMPAHECV